MNKRLTRSQNTMIAGVCAGIAEFYGWEVSLVRAMYFVLSIFSAGFPGVLVYLILWVIMPKDNL